MTTAQEFRSTIGALMEDSAVAGISVTSKYDSLAGMTVTPPTGTIRQGGEIVAFLKPPKVRRRPRLIRGDPRPRGARCFWLAASEEEPPPLLRCWVSPWWSSSMRKERC